MIDPSILFVLSVTLMPSFISTVFSKMQNPQFTVSENRPSTANTVFHSNLHYLLNEATIILGFSTITAC